MLVNVLNLWLRLMKFARMIFLVTIPCSPAFATSWKCILDDAYDCKKVHDTFHCENDSSRNRIILIEYPAIPKKPIGFAGNIKVPLRYQECTPSCTKPRSAVRAEMISTGRDNPMFTSLEIVLGDFFYDQLSLDPDDGLSMNDARIASAFFARPYVMAAILASGKCQRMN